MSPEVGMYVPVSSQFAFNFGAKYNYATKASHGRVPEMQSLTFNIGIVLTGMQ